LSEEVTFATQAAHLMLVLNFIVSIVTKILNIYVQINDIKQLLDLYNSGNHLQDYTNLKKQDCTYHGNHNPGKYQRKF
jgi:hypothetical protein